MSQTTQEIFETARPEVPAGLSGRILTAIELEAARQILFRSRVASGCASVSLVFLLVSFAVAGESFFSSDFWRIISLLFTDFGLALSYSEDFLASLAETFPAASASLLLTPLFLGVVSLAFRSKYLSLATRQEQFQLHVVH
ncbi:MAG: hypothetical protein IPJ68_04170 [Candidatus Moraniibacteriota bacterium]|nr:MAG: hypothetical protein IPJ68_04170 [Candidatus Moranbacteria bacterium]